MENITELLNWQPVFDKNSGVVHNGKFFFIDHKMYDQYKKENHFGTSFDLNDCSVDDLRNIHSLDDVMSLDKIHYYSLNIIEMNDNDWHLQYDNLIIDKGFLFQIDDVSEFVKRINTYCSITPEEIYSLSYKRCEEYHKDYEYCKEDDPDGQYYYLANTKKRDVRVDAVAHSKFFNCGPYSDLVVNGLLTIDIPFKKDRLYQYSGNSIDAGNNVLMFFYPMNKSLTKLLTRKNEIIPEFVVKVLVRQGDIKRAKIVKRGFYNKTYFYERLNDTIIAAIMGYDRGISVNIAANLKKLFLKNYNITNLISKNFNVECFDAYLEFLKSFHSTDGLCSNKKSYEVLEKLKSFEDSNVGILRFIDEDTDVEYLEFEYENIVNSIYEMKPMCLESGFNEQQFEYIKYLLSIGEPYDYLDQSLDLVTFPLQRDIYKESIYCKIANYLLTNGVISDTSITLEWYLIDSELKAYLYKVFKDFGDFSIGDMKYHDFIDSILDKAIAVSFYYGKGYFIQFNNYFLGFDKNSVAIFSIAFDPKWRAMKLNETIIISHNDIDAFI